MQHHRLVAKNFRTKSFELTNKLFSILVNHVTVNVMGVTFVSKSAYLVGLKATYLGEPGSRLQMGDMLFRKKQNGLVIRTVSTLTRFP